MLKIQSYHHNFSDTLKHNKLDNPIMKISLVVPVFNSFEMISHMVHRTSQVLSRATQCFELILVDDGSSDSSYKEIKRMAEVYPCVKGIRLSRNFGHQAALTVGLAESTGQYVAIVDDDLQDPPELLLEFFNELDAGVDVVYGIRKKRKENLFKRIAFSSFYWVLHKLSGLNIPMNSGDFCAMKRPVVDAMLQVREAQPFLRGIRCWVGFKHKGVEYERQAREEGESGYTLTKYFSLAVAGILSFSYVPLRIATFMGFMTAFLGVIYGIFVLVQYWIGGIAVSGFTTLSLLIVVFGGANLIALGIMGEYLARLSENNRRWPIAIVAETTDNDSCHSFH